MKKYILCIATYLLATTAYCQVDLDLGLIGYWPFNGDMADESQFGNDGVNNDCVLSLDNAGNDDEAYEFNGQTSFVDIPSSYDELTLPFSISAWVLKSEFGAYGHVFSSSSEPNAYHGIYLGVSSEGLVQISYTDGGPVDSESRRSKRTNSAIPLNKWVHIAVVVNGPNDMIIQFDSTIQEGEYSGTGGTFVNGTSTAMIGRAAHNPDYWTGNIDEVRLYNRALTSDELNVICNSDPISSVSEPEKAAPFVIYPNPSKDVINLSKVDGFKEYKIFDTQGKIMQAGQIRSTNPQLNISNFQTGNYIIKLIGEDIEAQQMFMVYH